MNNIVLNLCNLQASFRFPGRLIVSSLLLGLLSSTGTTVSAELSPVPLVAQSRSTPTTDAARSRIVGQWRVKDVFVVPITVIFTPEGKLFILTPLFDLQPPVAYEFGYQIGSNAQPMELDVTQSDGQTWKTIFEFTDSGQVRVEFIGLRPGEPRPTAFTTGAILAEKVSNLTALPRNTRITNFVNEQNKGSQSEGKQNLGTMNRAQQAYYLENEKFASRLEELGVGINPETENYRYRIVPQGNQTRSVMMTAQAKNAGLKSYTGAVFVVKVKDEDLTLAEICETDEPSSTPPAMPSAPKNGTTEIQCPAGSHRAGQRR